MPRPKPGVDLDEARWNGPGENMRGREFGVWTVREPASPDARGNRVEAICGRCGMRSVQHVSDLRGGTAACSCRRRTKPELRLVGRPPTVLLTARGVTRTLSWWAEETGLSTRALEKRRERGWSDERAVETPLQPKANVAKPLTYGGRTMTRREWAAEIGITESAFSKRVRKGWPVWRVLQGPTPSGSGQAHLTAARRIGTIRGLRFRVAELEAEA